MNYQQITIALQKTLKNNLKIIVNTLSILIFNEKPKSLERCYVCDKSFWERLHKQSTH